MIQNKPCLLLVDDDPLFLSTLKSLLNSNYEVESFTNPIDAEKRLNERNIPLVLLDLNLGSQDGLDILKKWKNLFPETEIVFCSGEKNISRAIECLRHGASDYIVKPFSTHDLNFIIERTLEKATLKRSAEKLKPLIFPRSVQCISESKKMSDVLHKIFQLKGKTHLNVLILGESGTGKEIVARLLNQQEEINNRPFVVANMPAIPSTLMEAELFGVEKGAFTDAKVSRPGKFEIADNGDIFLDEIGDLPFETQAKILRALQEKQIERVGSHKSQKINFRVISATHQPLAELIEKGKFREDLLYRLSDVVISLPPLRDRKEDIPALCEHFIQKYSNSKPFSTFSEKAMEKLTYYDWPGNIRQLESTIKRALVFNLGSVIEDIEVQDLSSLLASNKKSSATEPLEGSYEQVMEKYEKNLFEGILKKHFGNKNTAMEELKLSRATFYRKLSVLGIS